MGDTYEVCYQTFGKNNKIIEEVCEDYPLTNDTFNFTNDDTYEWGSPYNTYDPFAEVDRPWYQDIWYAVTDALSAFWNEVPYAQPVVLFGLIALFITVVVKSTKFSVDSDLAPGALIPEIYAQEMNYDAEQASLNYTYSTSRQSDYREHTSDDPE